jgi:septal ring factor EnvC (AmiA/AmiB activator)
MRHCWPQSILPRRLARGGVAALLLAGALTACVTSNDPHDGGFFNGIHGIASGTYQQRVDQDRQNVDELQKTGAELRQSAQDLDRQRGEAASEAHTLRMQLHDLQLQSERSRAQLAELRHNHSVRVDRLDALNAERQSIERQVIDLLKRNGASEDSPQNIAPSHPPSAEDIEKARVLDQKQKRLDDKIALFFGK